MATCDSDSSSSDFEEKFLLKGLKENMVSYHSIYVTRSEKRTLMLHFIKIELIVSTK